MRRPFDPDAPPPTAAWKVLVRWLYYSALAAVIVWMVTMPFLDGDVRSMPTTPTGAYTEPAQIDGEVHYVTHAFAHRFEERFPEVLAAIAGLLFGYFVITKGLKVDLPGVTFEIGSD